MADEMTFAEFCEAALGRKLNNHERYMVELYSDNIGAHDVVVVSSRNSGHLFFRDLKEKWEASDASCFERRH